MKKLVLLFAILIPFTFAACSKKADETADNNVELVKAEADKAKAEADKAKAEAEKAKADADKAKAEAEKAKADADKAKVGLAEPESDGIVPESDPPESDDEIPSDGDNEFHAERYTAPEDLPDLDGTIEPTGLHLVMDSRPSGIQKVRAAGTQDGTYIIQEIYDGTIELSVERRKGIENKDSAIVAEVSKFAPDARELTLDKAGKLSKRLSYPAWKMTYLMGYNEDMHQCVDYYIQTDEFDFRFHTSTPIDQFEANKIQIETWADNLMIVEN